MLGLLFLAIAAAGSALLVFRPSTTTSLRVSGEAPCCSSCSQGGPCTASGPKPRLLRGQLVKGQLYRLRLSVDPRYQAYVKEQGKTRARPGMSQEAFLSETLPALAERLGFTPTLLVTHDPTDGDVWTLLTRWSLDEDGVAGLPNVTPLSATPTEEPPLQASGKALAMGLDVGLTDDEVWAISHALANDEDTKHLGGFASTFDADYPVAAGLLEAKAMLSALRSYQGPGQEASSTKDKSQGLTSLVALLRKATSRLGPETTGTWDKYAGLSVREKDEKTLGEHVRGLTAAFLARKTRKPPTPPSPAALQLALATRRPQLSLVEDDSEVQKRLTTLGRAARSGDPSAKMAQAKLEDANRTMGRLQWVEWYRRHSRAAGTEKDGPDPGSVTGTWAGYETRGMVERIRRKR